MAIEKKINSRFLFLMVLAVGLSCICFLACGGSEKSNAGAETVEKSVTSSSQTKAQPKENVESASTNLKSTIPTDWKTVEYEDWSISFPKDWSGGDAGIWWPGEGDLSMGRPALSVHCGGIPLMPNKGFEERIKGHIHGEPQERKDIKVSGVSGFTCSWEFQGNKHLGLFLEEKIGGMSVIHFVDCQAPSSDFDKHKATFEKIISSFNK